MKGKVAIRKIVEDLEVRKVIYQYVLDRIMLGETNINTAIADYFQSRHGRRVQEGIKYFPEIRRAKSKPFTRIHPGQKFVSKRMVQFVTEDKEFIIRKSIQLLNKKRRRFTNA